VFSAREYPNVRRHFRGALRRGWPRRLVLNRRGADARRERALRDVPTREGSIATSTPQPLAAAAGPGWSVVATRAAGRPTCAMCPAPRTDRTARRSEADSSVSATGPAFAMCSADSASYPLPTTRNSGRLCSASRIAACHLPGRSSKCPRRGEASWNSRRVVFAHLAERRVADDLSDAAAQFRARHWAEASRHRHARACAHGGGAGREATPRRCIARV
jgi:hypothetical protein